MTSPNHNQFERGDGVWLPPRPGTRARRFGKVQDVSWKAQDGWIYDVLVDGEVIHDVPRADLEHAPLCPECGEEAAIDGGRGFECRGRSML